MGRLSEYDYPLPEELIAQTPAADRSGSRLLVLERDPPALRHERFSGLVKYLRSGDALVVNDTRVIPARLAARRITGGVVEIFLLEQTGETLWDAFTRPAARLKVGERLILEAGGEAELRGFRDGGIWSVRLDGELGRGGLDRIGRMPLPRYIRRGRTEDPRDALDRERYQTVYGTSPGAVAAPTAGLHFTVQLLDEIRAAGVRVVPLTLHVGAGTFAPVREEDYTRHRMHEERFSLTGQSAEMLNLTRAAGGRIVAVGTTSARVIETVAAARDGAFQETRGKTALFIHPPYRFRAVDALVTNFHLPRSTLLLLVSALAGRERILAAYQEAVERRYRFFSYGDAMLIL